MGIGYFTILLIALAPKGPLCYGPEGTDIEDDSAGHLLVPMREITNG